MSIKHFRLVIGIALALLLLACGGGRKGGSIAPPAGGQLAPPATAQPAPSVPPGGQAVDEVLAELEAMPTPEGVSDAVFSELKAALRDALTAKGVSKLASGPPIGPSNSVDDLTLVDYGNDNYGLTWSYTNVGDYNQDGIVNISDITPLAVHFNEAADPTNEWIDGNGDTVINISDITPLAAGFFNELAGYSIQADDDPGGVFPEVDRVNFADATGENRLRFSVDLAELSKVYYRVVPFDSASAEGEASRVVSTSEMAFNPVEDTELGGGSYAFSSANIPSDVTVTVLGDAKFEGSGDIIIDGTLTADGTRLEIITDGNIIITGTVDNSTESDPDEPGDLVIHSNGGEITLGTEDTPATIQSSGDIDIADAPDLEEWELDVLPDERSISPLPPVCSASADIIHDTVLPDLPVEVAFLGEGADPDGGPVTYEWDFGDGEFSTERDPLHEYTDWGVYDVTLTVTDDDAESSQASLRIVIDDGDSNLPESPGLCMEPADIVVGIDEEVLFSSDAADAQAQELTYAWDFGDMGTSTDANPSHAYAADGRYEVTLTVTDTDTNESTATASVYVYSASAPSSVSQAGAPRLWNARAAINPPVAPRAGRRGRGIIGRGRGNIIFGAASSVQAQDGADGVSRSGVSVRGGNGGRGGSLQVLIAGTLTVRAGATFHSGDGGDGGNATAVAPAGGNAYARGGNGGNAGRLLRLAATQGISFQAGAGMVVMNPGSGGNGGIGDATGGDGAAQCPRGQDGGRATAYGGRGGKGSKTVAVRGNVVGLGNVEIQGGKGGDGGKGDATGGAGGAANCATTATGGNGKRAYARGGRGGDARLSGAFGGFGAIAPDAFTAGDGGMGEASGGGGGSATANPPGPTTANGGNGAKATAVGGKGGRGYRNGAGGDADARGGTGGMAIANPEHGGPCENGKSATATGGDGGDAHAKKGRKGGAGAGDGTANATGGAGGIANATGGNGGDCDTCPAGAGGDGADGTATGGDGGDATGNGTKTGGTGGNADAFGGDGGDGASCCVKFFEEQGGDGGDGGDATSTAGHGGSPGSVRGVNGGKAGDGGDGGDGWGFGLKGLKGTGTGDPNDVNDGEDGEDGDLCPPWTIWYIYLSTISPGPVEPGSFHDLDVYLDDKTTKTGDTVEAYFLTEAEFGAPVGYSKEGDFLFVSSGRVEFDLSTIPGSFPVGKVEVQIDHSSMEAGAIQLVGYYEGGSNSVGNTAGAGGPVHETLELPPAPEGTPYLGFALEAYDMVGVECWWIQIIDP